MAHPIHKLKKSMRDVQRLLKIHKDVTGEGPGRRYGVDVLNRSAVVFACAAWEGFVEDIAEESVTHIVNAVDTSDAVSKTIKKEIAKSLEADDHNLKVWDLAGDGWQKLVLEQRDTIISQEIEPFNTPDARKIRKLFTRLLDEPDITDNWAWQGLNHESAVSKLRKFVSVRGAIAHRGTLDRSVTKGYVEDHVKFVIRLSVRTSNKLRTVLRNRTNQYPWNPARYGSFT